MEQLCAVLALYFAGLPFCAPPPPAGISGYIEGEYIAVAPIEQGIVRRIRVSPDDHVEKGQLLAELDAESSLLSLKQARAGLKEAEAVLENMRKGQRQAEIDALTATIASGEAEEKRLSQEADRTAALFQKNVASTAQNDQAQAALSVAHARLQEARAKLAIARLPARPDELAAQEERVQAAEAAVKLEEWRNEQLQLVSETAGTIENIVRHPGEIAGPAAPVLSLLPDGAVKIKFYVTAEERARFPKGAKVALSCSGCPEGLEATISRVAGKPEFTPPVIYSVERSQKLMYLVEAHPTQQGGVLQPGQIVSIKAAAR